ncbi:MAG TPA: hypothetical protein VJ773_10575, partial [Gemmatimonadales bacterium]|nr:hypothetical protein [Gemmatimonadales bacterium]
ILLIESDVDGEDDPVVHMAARYSHLSRIRSDSATNVYGEPAEVLLHIASGWELPTPFRLSGKQGSDRDYAARGEYLYVEPEDEMLIHRNHLLGNRFAGEPRKEPLEDEEEEIRGLFHTLWSSQCDSGYDVKQWERLRYLLLRKGIEL